MSVQDKCSYDVYKYFQSTCKDKFIEEPKIEVVYFTGKEPNIYYKYTINNINITAQKNFNGWRGDPNDDLYYCYIEINNIYLYAMSNEEVDVLIEYILRKSKNKSVKK